MLLKLYLSNVQNLSPEFEQSSDRHRFVLQLKYLYLSGNLGLEGELPSVASLASLEGLYISSTNISGFLPCELGMLPSLKSIEAVNTQVTSCLTLDCLQSSTRCVQELAQREHGIEL
jgi:hypothetical protein